MLSTGKKVHQGRNTLFFEAEYANSNRSRTWTSFPAPALRGVQKEVALLMSKAQLAALQIWIAVHREV